MAMEAKDMKRINIMASELYLAALCITAIAYRAASPTPTIAGVVLWVVVVSALAAPLLMMLVVATERRQGAAA